MATDSHTRHLMKARVRLPDNVVYRAFANETVVLNLQSGQYHGLNPTGGRMLEVLTKASSVSDAIARLAAEYGVEPDVVAADLSDFCKELQQRGLIELSSGGGT